jgi:hypothetical protein
LVQNFYASQIAPEGLSEQQRKLVEESTMNIKNGKTNYFQMEKTGLTPPQNIKIEGKKEVNITWDTAYAADAPLSHYEVLRDGKMVAKVKHKPQTTMQPFSFKEAKKGATYRLVSVDVQGNRSESELWKT